MDQAANKGAETRNLERARKVQLAMLRAAPTLPGLELAPLYRAGAELGGDFYDFIEVDPEHLGIVVAGVAGQGPAAALLMASAKKVLQLTARGCRSPAKAILEVNDSIRTDLPPDLFVAVFYGVMHIAARRLTWVCAGMQAPRLARGGQVRARWQSTIGPALGVLSSQDLAGKLSEETVQLQPGDMLLACTHGVARAADAMRGGPGEDALNAALASAKSAEAAAAAIRELINPADATPADDQTILALHVLAAAATGPPKTASGRPQSVLPNYSTPCLGRERDIESLTALLRRSTGCALTLTGPAGVGKTRLSIASAISLREHFTGGLYYVDLQAAHSLADVCRKVAKCLQLDERDASLGHRVGTALAEADGPVLLILDNCDLAAGVTSRCLAEWREAAPGASFIATCRAPLDFKGEVRYELRPLAPERGTRKVRVTLEQAKQMPAVLLFVDAARREDPAFELNEKNCELIFEIVARLDFIPHAIELAASRIGLLSPRQMLERLDERLSLLRSESEDRTTMFGAIAWSWELLSEDARRNALLLCHYRDGFQAEVSREALGVDAGLNMDEVLEPLRRHSLAYADRVPQLGGVRRHYLYEAMRLFALDKVRESGQYEASRARFEKTLLAYARKWWSRMRVDGSTEGRTRLMLEISGLEDIVDKGATPEARAWAAIMIAPYLYEMGERERVRAILRSSRSGLLPGTEEWHWLHLVDIELKAEVDPESAEREADELKIEGVGRFYAHMAKATALARMGRLGDSVRALQAAAASGSVGPVQIGRLKLRLGQVYEQAGKYDDSTNMYQSALRAALTAKDTMLEAEVLMNLGHSYRRRANYTEASKCLREAVRLSQQFGDRVIEARSLAEIAVVHNVMGDRQSAEASILRSLRIAREVGSLRTEAICLNTAGNVYFEQGRVAEALKACEASRDVARACGERRTEINAESNIAALNIEIGQDSGAMEALEKAYRMARELKETRMALAILANIGELHAIRWKADGDEKHLRQAFESLRKAAEESRKTGLSPFLTAEQMLAELMFETGDTAGAREVATQLLKDSSIRGDQLAQEVTARAERLLEQLQVPAPPPVAAKPAAGPGKRTRPASGAKGRKRPRAERPASVGPAKPRRRKRLP